MADLDTPIWVQVESNIAAGFPANYMPKPVCQIDVRNAYFSPFFSLRFKWFAFTGPYMIVFAIVFLPSYPVTSLGAKTR